MACDPESVISSTDLTNLKSDITTIDDVVESSLDTTTTKSGKVINTLLGQLRLLGYEVPVSYAVGIVFTASDNTKTVEEAGVIYAPLPSALPFTTSGTFIGDDDARFFVVQGDYNLRTELAAADSAVSIAGETAANVKKSSDRIKGKILGAAVARQTTESGGWELLDDAGHTPINIASVAVSGTNLRITNSFTADTVGQFTVTPDEGYAALGLSMGASVGETIADISGYAPISARIAYAGTGIQFNSSSGNVISHVVDQTAGTITVTHAGQTHTDSAGTAVNVTQGSGAGLGRFVVSASGRTGFTLQYTTNLACKIQCTDATPGAEVFTITESQNSGISAAWISGTNCVRVTFPAVGTNRPDANITLSRDSATRYIYTTDAQGSTTCDVFFYDLTGSLITAATTGMIFHFSKPGFFPASIPAGAGSLAYVQRDLVPVDFDKLFGASSNLWINLTHNLA